MCASCRVGAKCCKTLPPMIFQFEKIDFQKNIFFDKFNSEKIPLLGKRNRKCIFLSHNKCKIYQRRPFNCEMFPFDIRRINNKLWWVVYEFCEIPKNIERCLNKFEKTLLEISKRELGLYVDYSSQMVGLRDLAYHIVREVRSSPIRLDIFQHTGHKFMFLDDYLWMWDTPQENELQENLAKKSFGDVLIAGYGFGILPKFLRKNPNVESITTVEMYREVIDKMKEFGKIQGKIIIGDFYDLPEDKKYDCVIGDIWPDIDAKFLDDYVKAKNKSLRLLEKNGKFLAWGGDFFEYLLKNKKYIK